MVGFAIALTSHHSTAKAQHSLLTERLSPVGASEVSPARCPERSRSVSAGYWMMGGGEIIASFLDQGEIDEFRIHVIPILIGEGIPLIQPRRHPSQFLIPISTF